MFARLRYRRGSWAAVIGAVLALPKLEIRNTKSETNSKLEKENSKQGFLSLVFRIANFEFVSDYAIRASSCWARLALPKNSKSETRNPKQIRSSKKKTRNKPLPSLVFRISDLFRISIFVLRVSGQDRCHVKSLE